MELFMHITSTWKFDIRQNDMKFRYAALRMRNLYTLVRIMRCGESVYDIGVPLVF